MGEFHKFKIAQHVELVHRTVVMQKTAVIGTFEITRLLPADAHGINHYHVRSLLDRHERVASEHELRPMG